jgi:hypothetical protein
VRKHGAGVLELVDQMAARACAAEGQAHPFARAPKGEVSFLEPVVKASNLFGNVEPHRTIRLDLRVQATAGLSIEVDAQISNYVRRLIGSVHESKRGMIISESITHVLAFMKSRVRGAFSLTQHDGRGDDAGIRAPEQDYQRIGRREKEIREVSAPRRQRIPLEIPDSSNHVTSKAHRLARDDLVSMLIQPGEDWTELAGHDSIRPKDEESMCSTEPFHVVQ